MFKVDSAHWERVQVVFHSVADLPEGERLAALRTACGDEDGLIAEVAALLREDAQDSSLLDRDVAQVAHRMLGDAAPSTLATKEFWPYRIQKVLGEGGMGVVYLAEREDIGRLVAIKILRDAWLSPARRERFTREQRLLAQLDHPYIARLYDADTLTDGTPWFVMEYVDGVQITEYCHRHDCSIEDRLKLIRAVCEAVQYAHQHAVIHRDLKPSNILVKPDGSVRLLDFGIAKQLDALGTPVDQTGTGMRLMTPAYAAPEQIRGERVGIHTDVYSLGVILYELLAGRLPFDISHKTAAEAAAIITTDEPAKPSAAARESTGKNGSIKLASWVDLDILCLTAMHKDPERRYQSAEALIRDIDHYSKDEPLEARPDTFGYTFQKFVQRNWQGVPVVAAVFALVLSIAWLLRGARPLSETKEAASVNTKVKTVAVLPFQNAGSDQSLDFLRLALPDEIATALSYTRSLAIRPFSGSSRFTASDLDLQKAGREMRVATIVTGHFLTAGGKLQITLEAVDVENYRLLWKDVLTVPVQNLIAMQEQVAAKARNGLATALGAASYVQQPAQRPTSEEAYDLYLRNAAVRYDPGPNRQALTMLEKAVELDPNYAPAWLALSRRYYIAAHYENGSESILQKHVASMERAVALDPEYTSARARLASLHAELGDLTKAYFEAEDIVRHRADNADGHFAFSYVLRFAGLLGESARECETALSLDPHNFSWRSCAVVSLARGDNQGAMHYINLDAGSEWSKALSIHTLVRAGKEKEALQVGRPNMPQWNSYDLLLACVAHRSSGEIAALAAEVRPQHEPETNYFSAMHLAFCGQTSAAIQMLKTAVQGKYCSYPAMDSEAFFASLRGKPEFSEVRSEAIDCQNQFLAQRGPRQQ